MQPRFFPRASQGYLLNHQGFYPLRMPLPESHALPAVQHQFSQNPSRKNRAYRAKAQSRKKGNNDIIKCGNSLQEPTGASRRTELQDMMVKQFGTTAMIWIVG